MSWCKPQARNPTPIAAPCLSRRKNQSQMRFSVKCAVIAKLVIEVTSTCEDVASKSALTRAAAV